MASIYKTTADRLAAYGLFDPAVIEPVARCAQLQSKLSYKEWFKVVGISDVKVFTTRANRQVPFVTVSARVESSKTLVIHLPMGNSLDESQRYQIATIAAVNPEFHIVAFGNPSGRPFHFVKQRMSIKELFDVSFTNKRRAVVASELEYITRNVSGEVYHAGYSFGALKAMLATTYEETHRPKGIILVDPVAHPRYRRQLLENFVSTFEPMGAYVDRTRIPAYFEARKVAAEKTDINAGLRRPINIAIGLMLAKADFTQLFESILKNAPSIAATVAWGSKSELGNDAYMSVTLDRLSHEYPNVQGLRLDGDKHSFANDIHLHAAIIRQGLGVEL